MAFVKAFVITLVLLAVVSVAAFELGRPPAPAESTTTGAGGTTAGNASAGNSTTGNETNSTSAGNSTAAGNATAGANSTSPGA